jgi:hypothetical protein
MEKNQHKDEYTNKYVGMGIAIGASFGMMVSLIFFREHLGVGIAIGTALGIVIGAIGDQLQRPPVNTLIGSSLGAGAGIVNGLILKSFDFHDLLALVTMTGLAIGLIVGATIDARQRG